MLTILVVEIPERAPIMVYLPMTFDSMETHVESTGVETSTRFRSQSLGQLRRIKTCLQWWWRACRILDYCFWRFGLHTFWCDEYQWIYSRKRNVFLREPIEWSYKDVKGIWRYCDYEHVLQLRKQPVAKIFFVCQFLCNVYVTMDGSQVAEYLGIQIFFICWLLRYVFTQFFKIWSDHLGMMPPP